MRRKVANPLPGWPHVQSRHLGCAITVLLMGVSELGMHAFLPAQLLSITMSPDNGGIYQGFYQ
jgi:hypothetical protein